MNVFKAILMMGLAIPAVAEHITVTNVTGSNTSQLFHGLTKYSHLPPSFEETNATWNAMDALLNVMAPTIRALTNFSGIFSGNCSVFFEDSVQKADCNIAPASRQTLKPDAEFMAEKRLPRAYWSQISLSHILLASIFADWTKGRVQKFDTDLYFKDPTFKRGSCSQSVSESVSESESASLSRDSTHSLSQSNSPDQSLSLSNLSSKCALPQVRSEWANWNRTTGVYEDAAKQTARFTTDSGVVTDSYTGLQWQAAGSAGMYKWSAVAAGDSAQAYCCNQTTGGFSDWHLPTCEELQTLIDYTVGSPMIDRTVFPGTQSDYYWTSTQDTRNSNYAWDVSFGNNFINTGGTMFAHFVRCVRSNTVQASIPAGRYADAGLQVKDTFTGLIWQRVLGVPKNWSVSAAAGSAQLFCNQLEVGAQRAGSWRLPTVKELRTLINMTAGRGALIDLVAFPGTPASKFWSSTVLAGYLGTAWYVDFDDGSVAYDPVTSSNYIRCVR